ncbi:unnamed protein product [Schistosoma margrebowiei]|uniref:Uncharacterized protein n=1 Tax=Schistosoma margrebowiei TaxID=48269 RepID=A0A183N6G5_9TREM|nr:unnamed protein product [Schistosoma margrebowiei]
MPLLTTRANIFICTCNVLRDTDRLNEFNIALTNRFQALQDLLKEEETTMDYNRKGIKEALTSTCQEVLGLKKQHHKEWISIEILYKIKERKNKKAAIYNSRTRAEKVQAQAEYTEANKQVKRGIRADKNKYVEELAKTAENTKLQHYGSSSNNQLSGTHHYTSTSLIMKRHLTAWIGGRDGNFFDTTEFLRLSTLSGTHTTDYNAKSCMEDS